MIPWLKNLCRQLYNKKIPLTAVANGAETNPQMAFAYAYTLYIVGSRVSELRQIFEESREEMAAKILSTPARVKEIEDMECTDLPVQEIVLIAMAYHIKTADLLEMTPFEWYFDINWNF